ncbi:alpha/beta hydrolase [Cytobacillus firmus]|uniref:alpha/beta hydrolase n=1 Tax=Cytobacillus firmus TaxID=1399 RepID=UPI00064F86A2|nr:alpha/beta fold hydrolase [Cytobacillus firmus]KML44204.1 carboxylesterase [Cytobacillus firmus]MBG9446431.1 carboxylesterase [Cytobacillus firmus]MBY6054600.1 alpha/beta fold hydrolase [Cytobacillus firmus]
MIGCMCIHGFTGAPFEVEPLAEYLKEHTDWEISVPTLPGHGDELKLKGIAYNKWIEHAEEELKRLISRCEKVYVIGFSMGGLIASYLTVHYPVDKLVLLSAAAYYVNPKQLFFDIKEMVRDAFRGNLADNEMFVRYKRKISATPITATLQFRRLVASIRPILNQITVPTLIAQGESDGVVPPRSARYLYNNISSSAKKLIFIKDSKHLICHCGEGDRLFQEILGFLQKKPE